MYKVARTSRLYVDEAVSIIMTQMKATVFDAAVVAMRNKIKSSEGLVLLKGDDVIGVVVFHRNETNVYRGESVNFIKHFVVVPEYRKHRRVLMLWGELIKSLQNGKKTFLISNDVSTFERFVDHVYSSAIEGYTGFKKLYAIKEYKIEQTLKAMEKLYGKHDRNST